MTYIITTDYVNAKGHLPGNFKTELDPSITVTYKHKHVHGK